MGLRQRARVQSAPWPTHWKGLDLGQLAFCIQGQFPRGESWGESPQVLEWGWVTRDRGPPQYFTVVSEGGAPGLDHAWGAGVRSERAGGCEAAPPSPPRSCSWIRDLYLSSR